MSEWPNGWAPTKLGELVDLRTGPFGSSLHQSDYVDGGTPIVNPMHIDGRRIHPTSKHRVNEDTVARLNEFRLLIGDIVIGRRGEMGRCAVVREREAGWICGTGSVIARPRQGTESDFLQYLLSSDAAIEYLNSASVGSTMVNLNQKILLDLDLLLPPRAEQTRIVEKLESLLVDLDAGVAELQAAQRKLARYRQSLLKAAVEGTLTAEWREANAPQETGAQLLARILRERRARFEQKHGPKKKYKEPAAPDTSQLPALPGGWVWMSVEQLGDVTTGFTPSTSNPDYFGGDIPFFKPTDLDAGYELHNFRDSLTELGVAQGRLLPANSVLVTCIGATIGKTGLARVPCTTNQQINAVSPSDGICPEYIFFVMTSPFGQRQIISSASATTLPILNKSKFGKLPVPLPPLTEQHQILTHLDTALSACKAQESAIVHALKQAAAQRRNLLRAAFAGELVPQDPADEPASVLLERIRAARAAQGAVKKPRGRKKQEAI